MIACLLGFSIAAIAAQSEVRKTLKVGDSLVVSLDSNHSTGYKWLIVGEIPPQLQLQSQEYVTPDSVSTTSTGLTVLRVGAPGIDKFTFVAVQKGDATLKFEYRRAWEQVAPANSVTYYITVTD